jgi:hypothetical protein
LRLAIRLVGAYPFFEEYVDRTVFALGTRNCPSLYAASHSVYCHPENLGGLLYA